jgi:8-oxo-dGTP diphosphatase
MALPRSPTVTVDAIIQREDKILLIRRKNEPFKGYWALPGGFIEYQETAEDAVRREVMEEAGLEVDIIGFQNVYSDPNRDPRGHVISLCYIARGNGVAVAGDDAKEARFIPVNEIFELDLAFDHQKILKEYMEKAHVL